ncbi:MAG: hypothetical protein AAF705_11290 [Bacteroidota bacterium]
MDKGTEIKYRIIKFLAIFSIACIVMMMIRLGNIGEYNPTADPSARYALITAVVSGAAALIGKRLIQAQTKS